MDIIKQEEKSLTPGFGVAGQVMCPISFMAPRPCYKGGCEWWVELSLNDGTKVARCAISWLAVLNTEIRGAIDRIKTEVKE